MRTLSSMMVAVLCLALLSRAAAGGQARQPGRQHDAMHHLFQALDVDGDGQVKSAEALQYLRDHCTDGMASHGGLDSASQAFIDAVDTADEGQTVSEEELQRALAGRLQVRGWRIRAPHLRCVLLLF
jgi:hypothetical protein